MLRDDAHQKCEPSCRNSLQTKPKGGTKLIWDFLQRYDESWIWRCADRHNVTESARNFAALEECIADAVRHGYVESTPARTQTRSGRARRVEVTRSRRSS